MRRTWFRTIRYSCAVLLIVSSIALVTYQVYDIDNVAAGLLTYVAQAFLLAGSIFGLEYYVKKLTYLISNNGTEEENNTEGDSQQQPAKYKDRKHLVRRGSATD